MIIIICIKLVHIFFHLIFTIILEGSILNVIAIILIYMYIKN